MSIDLQKSDAAGTRALTRPRPGHADLAGGQKLGVRDLRDVLERASARETAARVACGAIAKQLLAVFGIELRSHVIQLGGFPQRPLSKAWDDIAAISDDSPLRCADKKIEAEMIALIDRAKKQGDTLGGIFEIVARGVPVGLGSHTSWNEKLDGRIAQAIMSIHAVKALEIGTGIENASKQGSEVHDEIFWSEPPAVAGGSTQSPPSSAAIRDDHLQPPVTTGGSDSFYRRTNRAGGLEGGITNGEEVRVRGYLKPISTLKKPLQSVDINTKKASEAAYERSDITVVPAAGVIGESMLAIVLANSMREKFGGDSIEEMKRNFDACIEAIFLY
jgi:chorismate synthase